MTNDPYRTVKSDLKAAKLARPGHVWHPKHPIDWMTVPVSCLMSGMERVHLASHRDNECACYEMTIRGEGPLSRWARRLLL